MRGGHSAWRARGDTGTILRDPHAHAAALHLELADLVVRETLEELRDESVRIGANFPWIGNQAASRRITRATLWPPNPIEFESERSTFAFRAWFGT